MCKTKAVMIKKHLPPIGWWLLGSNNNFLTDSRNKNHLSTAFYLYVLYFSDYFDAEHVKFGMRRKKKATWHLQFFAQRITYAGSFIVPLIQFLLTKVISLDLFSWFEKTNWSLKCLCKIKLILKSRDIDRFFCLAVPLSKTFCVYEFVD